MYRYHDSILSIEKNYLYIYIYIYMYIIYREEEERDYILWLKGERAKMAAGESDFSGLHSVWTAPDLDLDEAFLRDYILNRGFIDRDTVR